jgi:hypothetical protein
MRNTSVELSPKHSMDEFERRGDAFYAKIVTPEVERQHHGKFLAIDIETGLHAIDEQDLTATRALLEEQPDAQIWLTRVGHPAAYRIGHGGR